MNEQQSTPQSRRPSRARKILFGVLAALAVAGITIVATPSPASASATWCSYTSTITVGGVKVPTGNYCFSVWGSGTRVDYTSGSWNGPWAPNPSERVTFLDRDGREYFSAITYRGTGNTYGYRYWQSNINGNARAGGSVCGAFQVSGVEVRKICHRIG